VELETGHALEASELAIGGRDLIAQGLITPGPELGRVLAQLLERVLEAPELNQKDDLLALATELCRV
jgi:tRNA nucleotidyltransferase (CCA-adding enzyme)